MGTDNLGVESRGNDDRSEIDLVGSRCSDQPATDRDNDKWSQTRDRWRHLSEQSLGGLVVLEILIESRLRLLESVTIVAEQHRRFHGVLSLLGVILLQQNFDQTLESHSTIV